MLRQVRTENGIVRGIEAADPRITAFKGIPFAAPPTGKNRWRAPQPCESWAGVRDCSRFAPISMQWIPGLGDDIYCREWHVDPEIPMGEDCLYLNVWTKAKKADEKMPVLVWFFGGGLQCGYPAEMEFDGERIARRGIVVVTVNYRVGALGFLTHPQISREQPDAPANFGNLDQQAGLKWVQRNIAAFGGDPGRVTIAGQSAGGGSVMSQLACPANKGLFSGAVVMSAMIFDPYLRREVGRPETLKQAEKKGEDFFAFLKVKSLEEARAVDAVTLQRSYEKYMEGHTPFFIVQDDLFCVGDPIALYTRGECVDAVMMAGNTSDEFLNTIDAENGDQLKEKAEKLFGSKAGRFLSFPETGEKVPDQGYAPVSGIECTVKGVLSKTARAGKRATATASIRICPAGTTPVPSIPRTCGSGLKPWPSAGDPLPAAITTWPGRCAIISATSSKPVTRTGRIFAAWPCRSGSPGRRRNPAPCGLKKTAPCRLPNR